MVGGEEDGVVGEINEKLYTTVEDCLATAEALGLGEKGRYMAALTFGNVHGVYKPGNVKLRPEILKEVQDAVGAKYGKVKPFDLVFHGGSGSLPEEISDAVDYGVIKMNVDTDTQYAFTRPVADHMLKNYDGVLKVDGEVGNKKAYDPRVWGKSAEAGHVPAVVEACEDAAPAGPTALTAGTAELARPSLHLTPSPPICDRGTSLPRQVADASRPTSRPGASLRRRGVGQGSGAAVA